MFRKLTVFRTSFCPVRIIHCVCGGRQHYFPPTYEKSIEPGLRRGASKGTGGVLKYTPRLKGVPSNSACTQGFFVTVRAGTAYRHLFSKVKKKLFAMYIIIK